jgi:hypothetical protein
MHRFLAAARRQWRWGLVGVGVLALVSLPALVDAVPVERSDVSLDTLVQRIEASADRPYHGYAEGRGALRLPELPGAADLSTLMSDTSRMRLWYDAPDRWRTDLLYSGGERDRYGEPDGMWVWDSGTHRSVFVREETQLRLPLPIDLTPPDLARRLLAAAQPDELEPLGPRRIAGRDGDGLRIRPSAPESTIDTIDIWADPETGLPLHVEVTAKSRDNPSLQTGFLELEQERPDPDLVSFEPPTDGVLQQDEDLDLVQAIERYSRTLLPDTLAGRRRVTDRASAAAVYGEGYTSVGVLALPQEFITDTLRALPTSERPWGQTVALIRTPLVNGMIFADGGTAYILGGPVTVTELDRLAQDLVAQGVQ